MSAFRKFLAGLTLLMGLCTWALLAQDARPTPPPPPPPSPDGPAAPAQPAEVDTPAQAPAPAAATPAETSVEEAKPAAAPTSEAAPEKSSKKKTRKPGGSRGGQGDAPPFGDHKVGANNSSHEAVSVFGSSVVDGTVTGEAVSVFGDTVVNGSVAGEAVAVMGNVRINGEVGGQVVAVMGDVYLGSKSKVGGQIVVVCGRVIREEGAQHTGNVQQVGPSIGFGHFGSVATWFQEGAAKARLLWMGSGSGLVWMIALIHLGIYLVIALVLPRGVEACVETFEEKPGMSILAAFLSFLLTPLVVILLAATVIGLPVALAALFFLSFFSRAVMHAWIGRLFLRPFGIVGSQIHVVLAVLTGGVVLSLIYCVPVVALVVHALLGALGVGVVIYTLLLNMKREKKPTPPPAQGPSGMQGGIGAEPPPMPPVPGQTPGVASVASTPAAMTAAPLAAAPAETVASLRPSEGAVDAGAASAGFVGAPPASAATPSPVPAFGAAPSVGMPAAAFPAAASVTSLPTPTPSLPASSLPRAGFGIRMGALLIDVLLVSALVNGLFSVRTGPGLFFACIATYGAVLWKLRGTTVGGIVFKLQVVRTDDRPLDWPTTVVRALGCVLSAVPAGLGFFWMLFDEDKQTWHDKIAGTAVVRNTSSRPLV